MLPLMLCVRRKPIKYWYCEAILWRKQMPRQQH